MEAALAEGVKASKRGHGKSLIVHLGEADGTNKVDLTEGAVDQRPSRAGAGVGDAATAVAVTAVSLIGDLVI